MRTERAAQSQAAPPESTPDLPTTAPVAQDAPVEALPSLEAIANAWTTTVLVSLRPKVRAIFQAGRLSGIETGVIVMSVPNDAHMLHAEPLRNEVEKALSEHFGQRLVVRLSSESAGRDQAGRATPEPAAEPGPFDTSSDTKVAPPSESDGSDDDFADIAAPLDRDERVEAVPTGVDWAKARVLEAFPGAEEV
jgi:hypothetical protein